MHSKAQEQQITGTVTSSEDGSPLPGVTILVKGSSMGTVTDFEGRYTLDLTEDDAILVFSFVGMLTSEVPVAGLQTIDVILEPDAVGLDEVVVTALGITKEKKSLGYSVQDLSSDELNRAVNPSLMTTLSGKVSGIEVRQSNGMPGAPSQIFIRGARSFSGNNEPLYVVDGMPISSSNDYGSNVYGSFFSNRALDLDPNSIESINVLKGQAAAALYGMRASNGVILITTKTGASASGGRPTVNVTTSYTVDAISRYPERQSTWGQGILGPFAPTNSNSWGPRISEFPDDEVYGGNNFGQSGLFFDPYKGEWVEPLAYDNPREFFQRGYTWQKGVSISNATPKATYILGFNHTGQEGIIPSSDMHRTNANAGATMQLGKRLKAGFSGNYANTQLNKLPGGNDSYLFTVIGSPPSFDLMGTPYHQEGINGDYRQISYRRGAVGDNPRWALENYKWFENTDRFFGNTFLEAALAPWMTFKYQVGIDTYNTGNEEIYQMGGAATGQFLPTAAHLPSPENPDNYTYIEPTGGQITNFGVSRTTINSLATLRMDFKLGENMDLNLVLGNEFNDMHSRKWEMIGTGFNVPGWNNMDNTNTQTAAEAKYRERTAGFFANLALNYKSLLYLNLTGRNDIVSHMPRGNRSFFYPSASLGFVFTELESLKGSSLLSFGKIRLSYAEVGQAGYFQENVYIKGGAGSGFVNDGIEYPVAGITGYKPDDLIIDPDLRPQNTVNWEVGTDLKFFQNRLGIDYAYSDQVATDQIFDVPMAGSTGYAEYRTNAGKMTNKVHELTVYITPVRSDMLNWNISANFTRVSNQVVELTEGVESISLAGYTTPNVRAYAGYSYPSIYGMMAERDEEGRIIVDDNPDSPWYGTPNWGLDGIIGEVTPDFMLSFTNTFTLFQTVTLLAQVDWKKGGDIYSGSNRLFALYGTAGFTEDRESTWHYEDTENALSPTYKSDGSPNDIIRGGPGDEASYFNNYFFTLGNLDEAAIYETSYVKLREVSLSFDLPPKWTSAIHMQNAILSLVARNILLWSTLPNFDPEVSQGQGNGQGGFDYMSLPQTSSFGLSLNLKF
jgi:TonB-linked SusC/RagA family outer membrane protein